jgi:hypothetical protein
VKNLMKFVTSVKSIHPLYYDYPTDPAAVNLANQFILGPDLLVVPMNERGAVSREVYLPTGTTWVEAGMARSSMAASISRRTHRWNGDQTMGERAVSISSSSEVSTGDRSIT